MYVNIQNIQDDQVYLEDDSEREEYVMRETGRIWMGTVGRFCVRPWNFAQVKCFFHVCHWQDWPGMNGNYGKVLCLTVELCTGKLLHTVIVMRETCRI